ncbi:hypothetical protein WJX72_007305 [[Myrmecia] bisecta]|uniref:NADH-ubiquinone oxidoreductase 12 kDa subunit n=1 Tax=[Myrmecia] bisecta TaxID=41462 RepID=A0AAW1PUM3_9CHLO
MGRWSEPKFPAGPPENFNPEDPYADPLALLEYREYTAWDKMVKVEKAKIIRDNLRQCYLKEGVNHYQNCRELALKYIESIKNVGIFRSNSGMFEEAVPQKRTHAPAADS